MKNSKKLFKAHDGLKRFIFLNLCCISLCCNAICKNDTELSGKIESLASTEKYKYTITHSFKKVGEGEKVKQIYFAVPQSNDYQEISNYYISKGKLLTDNVTGEYYAMWDVSDDMSTESGEWFEFSIEFDYIPKSSEYQTHIVDEIYPYDTTSSIYKMYTQNYYGVFVKDNPVLMKVSQEIWDTSADIYDYAKKCLEYTVANFSYKKNGSMLLSYTLENRGGDCGNLAGVFISLLRTQNIPSRLVIFREHVWAEFYLENYGWIPADPTFNLFGKAPAGYSGQIAWSNNIVYHVIDPSGSPKTLWHLANFLHLFVPTPPDTQHRGYECDIKMSKKDIIRDKYRM